jgi:hypothetical protein
MFTPNFKPLPSEYRPFPSYTDQWHEVASEIDPNWLSLGPEETRALAGQVSAELVYRQLKKAQDENRTIAATQSALKKAGYYPILFPVDPKDTPSRDLDANGYEKLVWPRHHMAVPEDQLGAFAKRYHLDERKLLDMLNGGSADYQGYSRYNFPCVLDEKNTPHPGKPLGQQYDPRPEKIREMVELEARAQKKPSILDRDAQRARQPVKPYTMRTPIVEKFIP